PALPLFPYTTLFRSKGSFDRAMETYDALAELQASDPRLRIHAVSTATNENLDEIARLTDFLFERCPKMDHHNLALIRGDRKNPSDRKSTRLNSSHQI